MEINSGIVALKTIGFLTGFVIGFLTGIGIQTLIDKLINL